MREARTDLMSHAESNMHSETTVEYRACLIQPIVTESEDGRFSATAVVAARDGEQRTIGVDGDFAQRQEAIDRALERAIAWIDQRRGRIGV
jgi:hypothetical protein